MNESEELYSLGIWTAKLGNEDALISAWQQFAQWTLEHQPGAGEARMVQDLEHPNRFITFGPWEDAQSLQAWRQTSEFIGFVRRARELCEEIQPNTLKTVAHVTRS
jgi:heme-degrading monooxygenase HmoA